VAKSAGSLPIIIACQPCDAIGLGSRSQITATVYRRVTPGTLPEDQHYVVRSWVEAENAEWQRVRHQYTVKLIQVGDDEWTLLDIWVTGL
jgi:hypothetical protein